MSFYHITRITGFADNMSQNATVLVPSDILHGINYPVKGWLKFGSSLINTRLVPSTKTNFIRISKDIKESLNIHQDMKLCVRYENGILALGPVIGFITGRQAIRGLLEGSPNDKILQTIKAAELSNVFLYFLTIDDILWPENCVDAVVYNHEFDIWEKMKMPLPDVIYDRGLAGRRNSKDWERVLRIRERLNLIPELKKINAQHYFDKWDLHCRLWKHENMRKYLPDTVLYGEYKDDMVTMIDKYETVYLKACIGSNGRSVIRVKKTGPSSYEYDHFRGKLVKDQVSSLEDISKVAIKYFHNNSYIIQQGVDSLEYEGNKVDVRVLVQKYGDGRWHITSMPVRIATDNSPVTSTKSGSNVYKFEDAFLNIIQISPKQMDCLKSNIYKLIAAAVKTIEAEYGSFGELGIDVAIDKNYGLWFLEANSKPAKDTVIKSGSKEDIEKAFLPPFEYAKYLSGYTNTGDGGYNYDSTRKY